MKHIAIGLLTLALAPVQGSAPGQRLSFGPDTADQEWELTGPSIRVATGDRGPEVVIENGLATLRSVALLDGTIEFDVQLTRRRSFVQIGFRMETDDEHEEIYMRPHKSSLPDAFQYAPVRQGQSAWQLYHGPGKTAAQAFTFGQWVHVRLVIKGREAALFFDDDPEPAFRVPHLVRSPKAGYVALRGFVPNGTPGTDPAARLANVRVRPNVVDYAFPPVTGTAEPAAATGVLVRQWAVSDSWASDGSALEALPPMKGALAPVDADRGGLVELAQWRHVPETDGAATALAQITITSTTTQTVPFQLGFSDKATVFFNGRPVFAGDASYRFDLPRRDGLIGFDQAQLYLPLTVGDNVLSVVVSDTFGGWGLMGRFPNPSGLTVTAR